MLFQGTDFEATCVSMVTVAIAKGIGPSGRSWIVSLKYKKLNYNKIAKERGIISKSFMMRVWIDTAQDHDNNCVHNMHR